MWRCMSGALSQIVDVMGFQSVNGVIRKCFEEYLCIILVWRTKCILSLQEVDFRIVAICTVQ